MPSVLSIDGSGFSSRVGQRGSYSVQSVDPAARAQVDLQVRRDLGIFDDTLRTLRRDLEALARGSELRDRLKVGKAQSAAPAQAVSSSSLTLDPYATFTTFRSNDEVNTTPTSFTPFGPTVTGLSTTLPTLGGVYDGDQGDDVLTFEFQNNAVVGTSDKNKVRVLDGAGNKIEDVDFKNVAAGAPITLSNGLTLALGAGLTVKDDTFQVSVSSSIGSAVDPTKPFDGTRNDSPNFEIGLGVTAGSFEVNGVSIAVGASETIDDIVTRISASAAGVDASFDLASERVVLTQRTSGSGAHISVGNDSSGFLSATKLAGASEVLGQDGVDPTYDPISTVASLSGISTGQFSINGTSLSVDVDVDSLGDVLDRINASGLGVTATLDPGTKKVSIVASSPSAPFTLDDGTSGLFSTLQITPKLYDASEDEKGLSSQERLFANEKNVREDLFALRRSLNAIFTGPYGNASAGQIDPLRSRLVDAIRTAFENLGEEDAQESRIDTGFGLVFDFERRDGSLLEIDGTKLAKQLEGSAPEIWELLFLEEDEDMGLVPSLLDRVESLQAQVGVSLGLDTSRGSLIDVRA